MKQNQSEKGLAHLGLILGAIFVLVAIALGGWYVWQKNKAGDRQSVDRPNASQTTHNTGNQNKKPTDPSEGGKYLVITEWGVRFELPEELRDKVSYSMGEIVIDPDNNNIQAAKILLKDEPSAGNECTVIQTSQGNFIDVATQVLRVEKSNSFDSSRYKGTFKKAVFDNSMYFFHLNYTTPGCVGSSTIPSVDQIQSRLEKLENI